MLEPLCCIHGATIRLARSMCTMLNAETTCLSESSAAFCFAHFVLAARTAMPVAVSFFIDGGCLAVNESAEPVSMLRKHYFPSRVHECEQLYHTQQSNRTHSATTFSRASTLSVELL